MTHKISINIHGVTYKQYIEFSRVFAKGNQREAMRLARDFVLAWDYEQSLEDPKAVMKLDFEDGAEVTRTLFKSLKDLYENAAVEDVDVSFKTWTMDQWITFDDLRLQGDIDKYEPMMHEVASMEGTGPDKPLTLYQGIVMNKAITAKATKVMSGGN